MTLTRQEQERKDRDELAAARVARRARLIEAEDRAAASDAKFAQFERARLTREAAARRERLAAYAARAGELRPATVRITERQGRRCEVRSLGNGVTEYRYLDDGRAGPIERRYADGAVYR